MKKNKDIRIFGEIEGTYVGQIFKDRKALADAGIHKPPLAGIWGSGFVVVQYGRKENL